jgi:mevalonate kinase
MPAITSSAPGKIILFGEHAVVYERPAIAVPVQQLQARAVVTAEPLASPGRVRIEAPDIHLNADFNSLPSEHPIRATLQSVFTELGIKRLPAFQLYLSSTIPMSAGLGSGTAVTVATIRAVAEFLGKLLPNERVSALAFEVEKIYHGTPSGIDNTVVVYNMPVFFQRAKNHLTIEKFQVPTPFWLVIGDTGIRSATSKAVGELRQKWQDNPSTYEPLFDRVAEIVLQARQLIENGVPDAMGTLMLENHSLLQEMEVSSPELDRLVDAAIAAGAYGAKLSGGGKGGNMIALSNPDLAGQVAQALQAHGAVNTTITEVHER